MVAFALIDVEYASIRKMMGNKSKQGRRYVKLIFIFLKEVM